MSLGFNQRLEKGKRTEAMVAHYASSFGWTVDAIGSIGDQKAPSLITTNEAGEFEYTRSPDLVIDWRSTKLHTFLSSSSYSCFDILVDDVLLELCKS